jgi:hypothetical protein
MWQMISFASEPHLLKEKMSRAGYWTKPSRFLPQILAIAVLQARNILYEDILLRYTKYAKQNHIAPI